MAADPATLDAARWNRLAGANPFVRHEFLAALHETGCATARTGWAPQFLVLERGGALAGAMPLYLKSHSYGEYVFDWAWADAYHRHGLEYYPKLLAAVPFSPVSAPKLLAADEAAKRALVAAALALAPRASSLHVLFPEPDEARMLAEAGCMLRRGVQFHWMNRGYADFEAFLATLSHAKRKKIRQERRRVREAGVRLRRLTGGEIGPAEWRFFARCYANTYRAHLSTPYLNHAFFARIGETMAEHLLLVLAERGGRPIAAALDLFTGERLYGRYWGAIEHVPALHFEACYYQAIEFAIERGIGVFEGGAQGEHKLARGFLPVETLSAHWLAHPEFADAVQRFLDRESAGVERYLDELAERAPFKKQG
ncbi:MAG: GNAT family N-acetyltransferase [Burkholderiales bacterium]|nr:GNAT family N-acetyltransferase [Burkholderiales bacterium]